MNDNPDLWLYQLVYGLTFAVMMTVGLLKGIGIARQLLLGKLILDIKTFLNFINFKKKILNLNRDSNSEVRV